MSINFFICQTSAVNCCERGIFGFQYIDIDIKDNIINWDTVSYRAVVS